MSDQRDDDCDEPRGVDRPPEALTKDTARTFFGLMLVLGGVVLVVLERIWVPPSDPGSCVAGCSAFTSAISDIFNLFAHAS